MKKYQIFVSSTFKDLKEERNIAINTIMQLGHIPAGMELFSSTGSTQFETIKPIIRESDYYLLIIGGKYGSINKETGLSYTEMEYDYAVKNNKRVIAFVYDDPENLPLLLRENTDRSKKKFFRFRKKVLDDRLRKMWHDKIDLAQSIATSISVVTNQYPAKTCWIHVNKDDIYTPIEEFEVTKEKLDLFPSISNNIGTYYNDISSDTICHKFNDNVLTLTVNMDEKQQVTYLDEFAGCYIRLEKSQMNWRQYVLENGILNFKYKVQQPSGSFWIELKSKDVELLKKEVFLSEYEGNIQICLLNIVDDLEDWRAVKEICFVFRPTDKTIHNTIEISDLELRKN